jgi:phospholipid/cholesterol/gamma-HCH transport system ATP-binding protein
VITIRNLHKQFGSQVVLDGVNLAIADRKITAILGPSGTGKSVLLKIITGLLPADGGEVLIDGESITAARTGAALSSCSAL